MEEIIIKKVVGREVLDSRGNPTVEAEVYLQDGSFGRAIVPSGASKGKYEANELRDNDLKRYNGKGVLNAVININTKINDLLCNYKVTNLFSVDKMLINLDSDSNKANLGANAILAVSIAFYKALANHYKVGLHNIFGGINNLMMPYPMLNIINGGKHALNNLDIQEFMIVPINFPTFSKAIQASVEVYQKLKEILSLDGHLTSVGDEGGFAPFLESTEQAIEYIIKAIKKASYKEGIDFMIALDIASSEWKSKEKGEYFLPKKKRKYSSHELIEYYEELCEKYPILSIEDALDEEDYEGWKELTKRLQNKVYLVGDDLFVTNPKKLQYGIENNIANTILIKPNQIGTIYETLITINMAKKANYKVVISHRSGDSEDVAIASLAFGCGANFVKFGAPCRSERTAKYNELIRIEEQII